MLAWSYGTGATTAAAHPYTLAIAGVDVVNFADLASLRTEIATDSNGSLEVDLYEPTVPLPIEADAYQDVLLTDNVAGKTLFSGLVLGVSRNLLPVGRVTRLMAAGYGILLDKGPIRRGAIIGLPVGNDVAHVGWPINKLLATAAIAPVSTFGWAGVYSGTGDFSVGRLRYAESYSDTGGNQVDLVYVPDDAGTGDPVTAGNTRSALDDIVAKIERRDWTASGQVLSSVAIALYVDPYRRLCLHPVDTGFDLAPFTVDCTAVPSGTAVAPEQLNLEADFSSLATGVFVSDSNTSSGGDNSDFFVGDLSSANGHYLVSDDVSTPLASAADVPTAGRLWLTNQGMPEVRGELVVVWTESAELGDKLTILHGESLGLPASQTVVVQSVSTQFLPGTSLKRVMTIGFTVGAMRFRAPTGSAELVRARNQTTRLQRTTLMEPA